MHRKKQSSVLRHVALVALCALVGSTSLQLPAAASQPNVVTHKPAQPNDGSVTLYGAPPDQAIMNEVYEFVPAVDAPISATLEFTITNQPVWASFDPATGVLSGTPTSDNFGLTEGIVISVTDSVSLDSDSLPPFEINVVETDAAFNEEPIFDNPEPPDTAQVGDLYYYDPGLYDPEGNPLNVVAENLPAWLSLDPNTGIISGTPGLADVGVDIGIVITATEGSSVTLRSNRATAGVDPNVVENALPPIRVDNPNLPYSPSSILFCGLTEASLTPKAATIEIKTPFSSQQDYEGWIGTLVKDIEMQASYSFVDGDRGKASIAVKPQVPDEEPPLPPFAIGLNNRSIKFALNGQPYTIPVKVLIGQTCSDGQLPIPTLALSRSKLEFGAFLGDPINSQSLKIEPTFGTLRWTANADQDWVNLSVRSGQAPQTITVGIDSSRLTEPGQHTAKLTLTDQNNNSKEIAIIANIGKSKTESDIDLIALEVTQGMQNLLNEMPLVLDRPTYVRAHVRSNTGKAINNMTAKLEVRRGNSLLGTITPVNEGGAINVLPSPDRGKLNDAFLFDLEPEWLISGTLTLKLIGSNQAIGCADLIDIPSDCQANAKFDRFVPAMPTKITKSEFPGLVKADPPTQGILRVTDADLQYFRNVVMGYFPISELKIDPVHTVWQLPTYNTPGTYSRLEKEWKLAGSPRIHYHHIRRPPTGTGNGGVGGGWIAESDVDSAHTLAQELGHNFYQHARCNIPPDDPGEVRFPAYVHDRISEATSGPSAYYGLDRYGSVEGQRIYLPTTKEVMSYCGPVWFSAFSFRDRMDLIAKKDYQDIPTQVNAPSTTFAPSKALTETNIIVVSGELAHDDEATLSSVHAAIAQGNIAVPVSGTYTLRLEKANGAVIISYPFDGNPIDPHGDVPNFFSVALPTTADPAVLKKITLLRNNVVELASITGSAHAPEASAQVSDDVAHEVITVTFTSTDADNNTLTHDVAYSPDNGQTWINIADDWPNNSLAIDTSGLPATTGNGKLRIFAHDGFYSAQVTLDLPNPIPNHRPHALIATPLDSLKSASADETIVLEGSGWDREDGQLTDAHLIWHSDLDGVLGTGEMLQLSADQLSSGQNTIWLEAIDSGGLSSVITSTAPPSATAALRLAQINSVWLQKQAQMQSQTPLKPTSPPMGQVDVPPDTPLAVFDINRDKPFVPPAMSVEPIEVSVAAGESTTSTVAIRNVGDGDPIHFTVLTDTLPSWASISPISGQTPASLVLTVNASGVPNSIYTGSLTFQSPDALLDNQVTVPYQIQVQTTVDMHTLTVSKSGAGLGVVTSDPLRLDCGTECSGEFGAGTVVTLTATAGIDSNFTGWSGDCSGSANTCEVTMSAAKNVTANFGLADNGPKLIYLPVLQR